MTGPARYSDTSTRPPRTGFNGFRISEMFISYFSRIRNREDVVLGDFAIDQFEPPSINKSLQNSAQLFIKRVVFADRNPSLSMRWERRCDTFTFEGRRVSLTRDYLPLFLYQDRLSGISRSLYSLTRPRFIAETTFKSEMKYRRLALFPITGAANFRLPTVADRFTPPNRCGSDPIHHLFLAWVCKCQKLVLIDEWHVFQHRPWSGVWIKTRDVV
jgi:hypothetical protein